MDALKATARQIFDQCCEDMRLAVKGLDAATLAKAPAPETSPLVTLVRHTATSTRYQLGCAATGRGDQRQYRGEIRPTAFAGDEAGADSLIRIIDTLEEEGRRLIADVPLDRLGDRVDLGDNGDDGPTRAWMLIHALEHFREHVGHAQLTRQVLVMRTED